MNISQMMRGLLGDATAGDSRALELKAGQVVRGVVLQMLENNEAVVQINGVQVRAKLEIPLQPGQSAMLQVQPETNGAVITLKPVDLSASGLLDDTFRDYAKLLGLPDQRWALDIIKDLRREGFPFNRITSKAFQEAAAVMPHGTDQEQWMQATAATFKRGLPMTATTISSMQQAMFGKGAHELLDTLHTQLGAFLTSDVNVADGDGQSAHPATRVLALLDQGAELLRGAMIPREGATVVAGQSASTASQGANTMLQGSAVVAQLTANNMDDNNNTANAASRPIVNTSNWLSGMMKWMGVDHELQLAKAATSGDQSSSSPASQSRTFATENEGTVRTMTVSTQQGGSAQLQRGIDIAASNVQNGMNMTASTIVQGTLNVSNVGVLAEGIHENVASIKQEASQGQNVSARSVSQQMLPGGSQVPLLTQDVIGLDLTQPGQSTQPVQQQPTQQDTMKNALLTLMGSNDTPPAIRETAQQLIHQITGQQLLLTPERNSSVLTHVTMFIPLQDSQGGSTASVHIQTRRGRRGELDADNCRLLFNLSMASLGDTLVDVNVTDKIVSLNLWNDHPSINELVEGSRADIAERLKETGYQLSSLRTTPLPTNNDEATATEQKVKRQAPPDLSQFASTRYKGVDFKA
ncbi:flagellar hook-length control protein FliK [Paenibacillus sp. GSMTC-2017]|uniref:flagellar hook-length control protein FliK n=1 Tax=Paenibacillus sp. GSMTC-2017 TaxID=2794350 RepID=UPI0018D60854|nr:flagellar hook-length control protein FliK [Paenibacillus sp. GSMTC-2017]MBH5316661.1 flagellar hook-length control protein FliK [Paenibacillus sp. GSMTC-2017]